MALVDQVVQRLCDLKQSYTQYGGMRPFGTSFIFAGWDEVNGCQIYTSDPSGIFSGWKAIAQGLDNPMTNNFLKQEYKENLTEKEGCDLAVATICKSLGTDNPAPDRLEIILMKKAEDGDYLTVKKLSSEELKVILDAKKKKDDDEAAKKK